MSYLQMKDPWTSCDRPDDLLTITHINLSGGEAYESPNLINDFAIESDSLPEWITECSNLRCLDCSNNEITQLPNNLPRSLKKLNCSQNKITQLPNNLPCSLKKLICWQNKITQLPNNLPYSLEKLDCSSNKLTQLPNNLPCSLKNFIVQIIK